MAHLLLCGIQGGRPRETLFHYVDVCTGAGNVCRRASESPIQMTGFGTDAFIGASLCYMWHMVNEDAARAHDPEWPHDANDAAPRVLAADSPETLMELRPNPVTQASSSQGKIDLFRSLFRGREDVAF
jgi:hypothetical protein